MKLIECYIESFGKLTDERFKFADGFNLILKENGYGKTTLTVFIKCMLYGMDDTRKHSIDENERKKYLPWSGVPCGGSLTFSVGEKIYRAERNFGAKPAGDTFILYDTALGRECSDFSENLGEEILGIDADGFMRTLFLSERQLSGKNENRTISAKLSELVGCDGDITGMTEATKLLEEQRKFYIKKGGSGEIADVKAEISRISDELDASVFAESRMNETELTLKALSIKETELRAEEQNIAKERAALAKAASTKTYKDTLADMKARLSSVENRRNALIAFFKGEIPTAAEIDNIRVLDAQVKSMKSTVSGTEAGELSQLRDFFDGKADGARIDEIKTVFNRFRINAYEESESTKRRRTLFAKRTPEKSEIEKEIADIKAQIKKPVLPTVFIITGAIISLLGVVLGAFVHSLLALVTFIGVATIALVPIIHNTKKKNEIKLLRKKLSSISDEAAADPRDPLIIYNEMLELLSKKEPSSKKEEDQKELEAFAALFGLGGDIISDISYLLKKYEDLKQLLAIERYKSTEKAKMEADIAKMEADISEFIKKFSYTTSSPLDEAGLALAEYTRLSVEIVEKRSDIERLTSKHETNDGEFDTTRTSEELDRRTFELSSLFNEIASQRALLERQYQRDSEQAEMREELIAKKTALEEKYEKFTDNLDTIVLTKKYLEAARENMTSRYLGKTKEGFEKYSSLIGGDEGSFDMDTSFAVSKTEGAKTHAAEAYSRGTRDLYAIAVRFALIDSLYEEEAPFVILDDPFISLDDKRGKAALDLVKDLAKDRQIIYFTCSESRA